MDKLCLVDFDDTLIGTDSFKTMMKKELWFISPRLFCRGVGLVTAKLLRSDDLIARSRFKSVMLDYYGKMTDDKKKGYISFFRSVINKSLVDELQSGGYDRIVIISASEETLIRDVMDPYLPGCMVIANRLDAQEDFVTCYGPEKVRRLDRDFPAYKDYEITVYTDSMSDGPIMGLASKAYMVDARTGTSRLLFSRD